MSSIRQTRWTALGTGCEVLTAGVGPDAHRAAVALTREAIRQMDEVASSYRADSELSGLNARRCTRTPVSTLLGDTLRAAARAERLTDGLVTPTLGRELQLAGRPGTVRLEPVAGSGGHRTRPTGWSVSAENLLTVHPHLALDLGCIGKAHLVDQVLTAASALLGDRVGIMINIGGDLAVRTLEDRAGWWVDVDEGDRPRCHTGATEPQETRERVVITCGALATSSTRVRRWSTGSDRPPGPGRPTTHHIVDPRTGRPAVTPWRCVTVHALTAVEANAASTAAVVLGDAAVPWLSRRGLAARLVADDGEVVLTPGWPSTWSPATGRAA